MHSAAVAVVVAVVINVTVVLGDCTVPGEDYHSISMRPESLMACYRSCWYSGILVSLGPVIACRRCCMGLQSWPENAVSVVVGICSVSGEDYPSISRRPESLMAVVVLVYVLVPLYGVTVLARKRRFCCWWCWFSFRRGLS